MMSSIQQQRCRDRGIDAARHCDDVPVHGSQLPGSRRGTGSR
jgi:hypothetical protein